MSKCLGEDSRMARNAEEDIHAEYDQERSSSKGQVPKDLIERKRQSAKKNGHSSDKAHRVKGRWVCSRIGR
jgi:hypothetical protein